MTLNQNIQEKIKKKFLEQIKKVENILTTETSINTKKKIQQLKKDLQTLKSKNIDCGEVIEQNITELEEQLDNIIQSKQQDFKKMIEGNNIQKAIIILKELFANDKDLFNKVFNWLNTIMKLNIQVMKNSYSKLDTQIFIEKFEKVHNLQQLYADFQNNTSFSYDQELDGLLQFISEKTEEFLNGVEHFLNEKENTNQIEIFSIFKYQKFLEVLIQNLQDNDLCNLLSNLKEVKSKILVGLYDLKYDQEKLIQQFKNGQKLQLSENQMLKYKKFDNLIDQLNKNNCDINEDIVQIGKNLKKSNQINEYLLQQYIQFKNQIINAFNQNEFNKVNHLIQDYKKTYKVGLNNDTNFKEIIKEVQERINNMTEQVLQIIKNTSKYDLNLSSQIDQIYSSEENLKSIPELQYETISQIDLINKEFNKKLEEILKNYDLQIENNIEKISNILIVLQQISEKLSRFSRIVVKRITSYLEEFKKKFGIKGVYELGNILNRSTTGKTLFHSMKIFTSQIIEVFNQITGRHGKDYVFDKLRYSDNGENISMLKNDQKKALETHLKNFEDRYVHLWNKYYYEKNNWGQIIQSVKEKEQQINFKNWNEKSKQTTTEVLANICAYWTLVKSEGLQNNQGKNIIIKPTCTQIIAIMMLLQFDENANFFQKVGDKLDIYSSPFNNKLIEILTGEGKSLILAFCSILMALAGCKVDVACYSKYLYERDYEEFKPLFQSFGVEDRICYGDFKQLAENFLKKKYGDIRQQTENALQNQFNNKKNVKQDNTLRILLIDEVDIFFGQDVYDKTHNPVALLKAQKFPEIEAIIRQVWSMKSQSIQQIEQIILSSSEFQKLEQKLPAFNEYLKKQMKTLSKDVKDISYHKLQHKYNISNNKIGYKNLDSSFSYGTTYISYKTLFAYFYEKEQHQISEDALNDQIQLMVLCGSISFAEIPNYYQNILGVTGTLQSLNTQMKKALKKYKINKQIYAPSMFGTSNRQFKQVENVKVEEDIENQQLQIDIIAKKAIDNNQSVLIFFTDRKQINEYLQRENLIIPREQFIIIAEQTPNIEYLIQNSTVSKSIALCIREYGRGTDFICRDDDVEKNGGVIVIQTFLSVDKTEEIQIMGRTARQGQKGKYYLILNEKDIINEFQIEKEQISSWKNSSYETKTLYQYLAETRDNKQNLSYQNIEHALEQSKGQHQLGQDYFESLSNGKQQDIINFINKHG